MAQPAIRKAISSDEERSPMYVSPQMLEQLIRAAFDMPATATLVWDAPGPSGVVVRLPLRSAKFARKRLTQLTSI